MKNHTRDMHQPPDIGHSILRITQATRFWKDQQPLKLTDLKPGDSLRYNATSEQPGHPAHCTDLWLITDDTVPKVPAK